MATQEKGVSPYRQAEEEFKGRPDELWEFLEANKREDPTLALGWAVKRAERFYGLDQVQIVAKTEVKDNFGKIIDPAFTKSYLSALLSRRTTASPEAYLRLARALDVNVLEFHIAEGWVPTEYIAAFQLPERELVTPILAELGKFDPAMQPNARAVVITVLQAMHAGVPDLQKRDLTGPKGVPRKKRQASGAANRKTPKE